MKLARLFFAIALMLLASLSLWALQFGGGSGGSRLSVTGEPDEPSEFHFSRLQYNSFGYRGFRGTWSQDFPRADNDCLVVIRRITRIDAPAPLNVADLDSDRIFEYPWIYAVGVSTWSFTDEQATRLRAYLDRGGFLMVDHFHGEDDWNRFMTGMLQVLPDATVEDLPDDDAIYHVLYSIDEKFQIPGEQYVATGRTYEKDGYIPRWRGIRDSHGRIKVAICANMHLGDAWEWANTGEYPEKFSGLAFRVVINYIAYSMSH
jgi:Domain of unknown function (DUF4159)